MKKVSILVLFLTLAFASCQNKYPDLEKGVYAEFVTNKGTFVAKLYNEQTPLTVANFVQLAEGTNEMVDSTYKGKRFFDGLTFHRIIKDFMIQGGDPNGDGTGNPGYRFPDEIVDSLQHDKKGILSMANSGPGTNGSQFFITLKETPWLNGRHTVFGEVVIGQEVVDSIGNVPTTKPGDKPIDPVTITSVNIINKGKANIPVFEKEMEAIELKKKEEMARVEKIASETAANFATLKEQAEEMPSGIKVYWNEKSGATKPSEGDDILMNYAGFLTNGQLFDSNIQSKEEEYGMLNEAKLAGGGYAPSRVKISKDAQLIPGFKEGLFLMAPGDKITLFIPSHLGYGERGAAGGLIPANADLIFELEMMNAE